MIKIYLYSTIKLYFKMTLKISNLLKSAFLSNNQYSAIVFFLQKKQEQERLWKHTLLDQTTFWKNYKTKFLLI